MRKFLAAFLMAVMLSGPAFAAASYNDKYILSTDPTFGNRVQAAVIANCIFISASEGTGVAYHRERQRFCATFLGAVLAYKPFLIDAISTDTNVISDATQAGTVALTSGNVATQAALVTDGHLDTAIATALNAFIVEPGS